MKKILFLSMLAAVVGFASCNKSDDGLQQNTDGDVQATFSVQSPASRATVTGLTRYIVEAYEGKDLAATPQRIESATGALTLTLKKNTEYTFVFWADKGTANTAIATSGDYYDATTLLDVKVNSAAYNTTATPAYCLAVSFNSKDFESNKSVVLKNATAQINFVETAGLVDATNTLTVKYSSGGKLNVATGKITELGNEISRTYTNVGENNTLVTDYILAPLGDQRLLDLKVALDSEPAKEIYNVPLQQNYKTNIKGEYSNLYNSVFTISNEVGDFQDIPTSWLSVGPTASAITQCGSLDYQQGGSDYLSVYMCSEGISYDAENYWFKGTGHFIDFNIKLPSLNGDFSDQTYVLSDNLPLGPGELGANVCYMDNGDSQFIELQSGSLTISRIDGVYTLAMDCLADQSIHVKARYTGAADDFVANID